MLNRTRMTAPVCILYQEEVQQESFRLPIKLSSLQTMFATFLPVYKLQCTLFTNPLIHIMPASIALQSLKLTNSKIRYFHILGKHPIQKE
jgi:hypothetical protein